MVGDELSFQWGIRMSERHDKKRASTSVANGVYRVNKVIHSAEPAIRELTTTAVRQTGMGVEVVGRVTKTTLKSGADWASQKAQHTTSTRAKLAFGSVQVVAKIGQGLGGIFQALGAAAQPIAPKIGTTIGGASSGVSATISGAVDSVALPESAVKDLQDRLEKSSVAIRDRARRRYAAILLAESENNRTELLDLLVVGGVSLLALVRNPSLVTPDIEEAFRHAYPDLSASGETFSDVVNRLDTDGLTGFSSAIKGKLFEQQFVDHLNSGNLPDGYSAVMATSPNQPGFDIKIIDESGAVSDLLQAKATDSVSYVKDALERYPEIDVVTTAEVYRELVSIGVSDRIVDSGITNVELESKVESAINSEGFVGSVDWLPSGVGLAVIALSCFVDGSVSWDHRSREFGARSAKAGVSTWVAGTAAIATQTWWLGVVSGLGAQWLASNGTKRRHRYEALKTLVETLEARATRQGSQPWIDRRALGSA